MGITTALTPQWVVSSSTCTNFWLLLPLSPLPPVRQRLTLDTYTPPTAIPTTTDLTTPLGTLALSPAPATSPSTVCTRERLRLRLTLDTSTEPIPPCTTPTPTGPE